MRVRTVMVAAGLAAVAAGCTGSRSAGRSGGANAQAVTAPTVELEPVKVVAQGTDTPDALSVYDARALFDRGIEFLDHRYYADARLYFQKLLDEFPDSELVPSARYNLGVALMESGDPRSALPHFDVFLAQATSEKDILDGKFKRGACLAMLGRYQDVVEHFDRMIENDPLEGADLIEAYVDSGIGWFMLNDRGTAEARFREAIKLHKQVDKQVRLDNGYHHSQALFYMAEIARLDFGDAHLVMPASGKEEELAAQLELKCERLLSAQYKYLQVIRTGHPGWAGAAGYKVGSLYEDLHNEMVDLPTPDDLTEDQKVLYRAEMNRKVSVLVKKAIKVWTSTMDMARRTGSDSVWIAKTQKSLDRMQELLDESERRVPEETAASRSPARG